MSSSEPLLAEHIVVANAVTKTTRMTALVFILSCDKEEQTSIKVFTYFQPILLPSVFNCSPTLAKKKKNMYDSRYVVFFVSS